MRYIIRPRSVHQNPPFDDEAALGCANEGAALRCAANLELFVLGAKPEPVVTSERAE